MDFGKRPSNTVLNKGYWIGKLVDKLALDWPTPLKAGLRLLCTFHVKHACFASAPCPKPEAISKSLLSKNGLDVRDSANAWGSVWLGFLEYLVFLNACEEIISFLDDLCYSSDTLYNCVWMQMFYNRLIEMKLTYHKIHPFKL